MDTEEVLRQFNWAVRLAAAVVIGVVAFGYDNGSGGDLVFQWIAFVVGALGVGWWLRSESANTKLAIDTAVFCLMAGVAGVACMTTGGGALVGFTFMAMFGAAIGLPLLNSVAVFAISVLAIEAGVVIFGSHLGTATGYPLILLVVLVGGRNRATYRVQAEQSAALVLQGEQLREQQRQAAVFDERTRIAREVHDVLAHSLGALNIQIQAARSLLETNQDIPAAIELLHRAQRLTTDGLTETRRAVQAMRTDPGDLETELARVIEAHRQLHSGEVVYAVDGPVRPTSAPATVALLRTAQETLVNAAKYAPGQPVGITLSFAPDCLALSVTNPVGPEASSSFATLNAGYGLAGLRERLALLGGTLVASQDSDAWNVTAQVPR